TEMSYNIGLATEERRNIMLRKNEQTEKIKTTIKETSIAPEEAADLLEKFSTAPLSQKQKAIQILLRPNVHLNDMINELPSLESIKSFDADAIEQAEIQIKYAVYIEKEKELVDKMNQLEDKLIPENFNFDKVASLSNE